MAYIIHNKRMYRPGLNASSFAHTADAS